MSQEATIISSLQIRLAGLLYQSQPTSFKANVALANGPSPGALTATLAGIDVSLTQLAVPGFCRFANLDDPATSTNYVEVGVYEPATLDFYPLLELYPGESYVVRLSRFLGAELGTTGTAALGTGIRLHVKAVGAPVNMLVEAFDRGSLAF